MQTADSQGPGVDGVWIINVSWYLCI